MKNNFYLTKKSKNLFCLELQKYFFLLCCLFVLSCKNASEETKIELTNDNIEINFVEGSADIPLFAGLYKSEESEPNDLGFESPSGSVISVSYDGIGDAQNIEDFYAKTLPQLGWKIIKQGSEINADSESLFLQLKRDDENLKINFINKNLEKVNVIFLIKSGTK